MEKNVVGSVNKAWGVLELDGYHVDDKYVINRLYGGSHLFTAAGESYELLAKMPSGTSCALIDEEKVMKDWRDKALDNGVDLILRLSILFQLMEDMLRGLNMKILLLVRLLLLMKAQKPLGSTFHCLMRRQWSGFLGL